MERKDVAMIFTQILQGWDIPTPESVLKISQERAARKIEGAPYSLLTNLAHTVLWQDIWLAKLTGSPARKSMDVWKDNFRVPKPNEWKKLRARFLDGLIQAKAIAESEPFTHRCPDDADAIEKLICIAIHASYHCGQLNLLKRMEKATH